MQKELARHLGTDEGYSDAVLAWSEAGADKLLYRAHSTNMPAATVLRVLDILTDERELTRRDRAAVKAGLPVAPVADGEHPGAVAAVVIYS